MKAKKMEKKEIGENPPSKQTCAFYIGTEKNGNVDYYTSKVGMFLLDAIDFLFAQRTNWIQSYLKQFPKDHE